MAIDEWSPVLPVEDSSPRAVDREGTSTGLIGLAVVDTDRPFACPLTGRSWVGRALAFLPPDGADDITLVAAHVVAEILAGHPGCTVPAPWREGWPA